MPNRAKLYHVIFLLCYVSPLVARGTLVVGGGGYLSRPIWDRFIAAAGGRDRLILVIPTAQQDPIAMPPPDLVSLRRYGARNIEVLHTREHNPKNLAVLVDKVRTAGGVWFTGGRTWRLADAYLDSALAREFRALWERGGAVGGTSAGASFLGEYLVRGDIDDNTKMMAPGHERGLGLFSRTAIDQHFFARGRDSDMRKLLTAHPELEGIGIDEAAAIVVDGSLLEVLGSARVAIFQHGHRRVLLPGALYDLREDRRLAVSYGRFFTRRSLITR